MATSNYSFRNLVDKVITDSIEDVFHFSVQSDLEKAAMAMRYATRTVSYYSPNYDYREVQEYVNKNTENLFDVGNNQLGG